MSISAAISGGLSAAREKLVCSCSGFCEGERGGVDGAGSIGEEARLWRDSICCVCVTVSMRLSW
jgi:hypothetical protein